MSDFDKETQMDYLGVATPHEVRTTSSTGGQKGMKLERHDLIPVGPLKQLAEHFGKGASKYDAHQWRKGYEWSKSYSALQRHATSFQMGEDFDNCPENGLGCEIKHDGVYTPSTCDNHTGSHHMVAVVWHAMVLLEFYEKHPEYDDRYI